MSTHELSYTVTYTPDAYYVEEIPPQINTPHYWTINSKATGKQVAFAFDENIAKTLCLALELIKAQVSGDSKKATQILRLIDRLSEPTLFKS